MRPSASFLTDPMRGRQRSIPWSIPGRSRGRSRAAAPAVRAATTTAGIRPSPSSAMSAEGGTASTGHLACARQYRPIDLRSARPIGERRPVPITSRSSGRVGHVDEHRAGLAALDPRQHGHIVGQPAEARVERVRQPLPGRLAPDLAEVRGGMGALGEVAARRDPGDHRHQRGLPVPRLVGRQAQRLQASERPVYSDHDPTHRGHDGSPPEFAVTLLIHPTAPRRLPGPVLARP